MVLEGEGRPPHFDGKREPKFFCSSWRGSWSTGCLTGLAGTTPGGTDWFTGRLGRNWLWRSCQPDERLNQPGSRPAACPIAAGCPGANRLVRSCQPGTGQKDPGRHPVASPVAAGWPGRRAGLTGCFTSLPGATPGTPARRCEAELEPSPTAVFVPVLFIPLPLPWTELGITLFCS